MKAGIFCLLLTLRPVFVGVFAAEWPSPVGGPFTVSCWITPEGITEGKQGLAWSWSNGWDAGMRLTFTRRHDHLRPSVHFAGRGGDEWFRLYSKRPNQDTSFSLGFARGLKSGERAHLATVFDGRHFRNYLNGVKVAEVDYAGEMADGGPRRWFFRHGGFGTGAMQGGIEGFSCVKKALDDDEIAAMVEADGGEYDRRPLLWRKAHRLAARRDFAAAEKVYREIGDEEAVREAEFCAGKRSSATAESRAPGENRIVTGGRLSESSEKGPMSRTPEAEPRIRIFVSPGGDDAADGSEAHPLKTLVAARDRLRELRKLGDGPAAVLLKGGRYPAESLSLGPEDSGSPSSPVIWCASGDGKPVIDGSRMIPAELWKPWKGEIVVADLKSAGFTGLGPLKSFGYALNGHRDGITDLYCDGEPLERARHPNSGFAKIVGADSTNKTFRLEGVDAAMFAGEKKLLATGYWYWFWSDQTVPVSVEGDHFRVGAGFLGKEKRPANGRAAFLVNSLKLLDAPGEWYLDDETGRLYLYPLKPVESSRLLISQATEPFISGKGVSNVVFRGLNFFGGRRGAMSLSGSGIVIDRCRFRDFGGRAIELRGTDNLLSASCVRTCGAGAVFLGGRGRVENCEISDLARTWRTYSPAVLADGRGSEIVGNEFHHMRSSAIRLEGHDHLVASNHVHHCVLESDDQGAVDIWGNPTYSGIRVIGNRWEEIGTSPTWMTPTGQCAVRLDDFISRVTIADNVFIRCGNGHFGAVQINKGRGNTIDNNLFIDCHRDVSVNAGSDDDWRSMVAKKGVKLAKNNAESYRQLLDLPMKNRVLRNVIVNTPSAHTAGLGDNRVFRTEEEYRNSDLHSVSVIRSFPCFPVTSGAGTATVREWRIFPDNIHTVGVVSISKIISEKDLAISTNGLVQAGYAVKIMPNVYAKQVADPETRARLLRRP